METSDVTIASAALVHLGRDPIATLDSGAYARDLRERLPALSDQLLRSYPWNFAMSFASLPTTALEAPLFGFTHRAPLPAGDKYCLRVHKVAGAGKYQVRGREIYTTSAGPVQLDYVQRPTSYESADPMFAELLSLELALALINKIPSGDVRKRRGDLERARKRLRRDARLSDAMEASPPTIGGGGQGSWIGARRPM